MHTTSKRGSTRSTAELRAKSALAIVCSDGRVPIRRDADGVAIVEADLLLGLARVRVPGISPRYVGGLELRDVVALCRSRGEDALAADIITALRIARSQPERAS